MQVVSGIWAVLTVIGVIDHFVFPPLRPKKVTDSTELQNGPLISVLIPARNEESNIERCVQSVCRQTYTNTEIFVIDDQSEDCTADLVRQISATDERVHLFEGEPLPKGWVGKGWALCQGHTMARGEWVILLDADTEMQPEAVATILEYAQQNKLDFVNPTPQFVNRSFWEKALQPLLWGLVMTRFPMMWVNQPRLKENMAFGPFLLIRSSVYDAVGGHRKVCHDILEDVALARLIKDEGYATRIVNGMYLFDIRMYENFNQILEGWIKTAFGAMNYNLFLMTVAIFGLFYMSLFPLLSCLGLVTASVLGADVPAQLMQWASISLVVLYARRIWDHYRFRFGWISLWMHPIGMFVVQYMQIAAVWKFYFGALTWKGRAYKPGEGLMAAPADYPAAAKDTDTTRKL